ncbi:uncharacterized protein FYW47_014438 [Aplochiton taeniatus]
MGNVQALKQEALGGIPNPCPRPGFILILQPQTPAHVSGSCRIVIPQPSSPQAPSSWGIERWGDSENSGRIKRTSFKRQTRIHRMAHLKKFNRIPMSKSMRELCKEEDYEFLGKKEIKQDETKEEPTVLEEDWKDKKADRIRRRQERDHQELLRLKEIEESKKEKEQQWKSHIAELVSTQEQALRERLARLRRFREFQKRVLVEELGLEPKAPCPSVDQLLTRM